MYKAGHGLTADAAVVHTHVSIFMEAAFQTIYSLFLPV
jgi:hypothetical protein